MEIPTAVIHRLQSSIREAASVPSASPAAAAAAPFTSVADAIAAFDSDAPDAPPELLCARCGAAGGLLRGAQSAICAYCGTHRREEGGGIAFRGTEAYRWLLGSLGLDGSELVEFDGDSTDSNKSKEAPKSGMLLSDLLDLKLTPPPENRQPSGSSTSNELPSDACTLNLSGVNLDSFFIQQKEETTAAAAAAALPRTHTVVQEKQSTNSGNHESSISETLKGFDSGAKRGSQSTNQVEAPAAFANWDADFQSTGSEIVIEDHKQVDLFKSASVAEPSNFPASVADVTPVVAAGKEANTKNTSLEHLEDLASASGTLNKGSLFIQKVALATVESNSGMVNENSAAEFSGSSLDKNSVQSNQLTGRVDTGVSIDEAFDDWQEFTGGGGNQDTLSNAMEHTEEPLASGSSETKVIDSWPLSSTESSSNVAVDSSDDWKAFVSSSPQGGGDLRKLVEGSPSGQGGGLVKPVAETSISLEHSSEVNSVDLWPAGNIEGHATTEIAKQTDDSVDDWQDFTTSGQAQGTSFSEAGDMMKVSHASHKEIDVDSWFTANTRESRNTDFVNGNNVMLDDWQGFACSDQAQQSSSRVGGELTNILFEQHGEASSVQSWANTSSKEVMNTVSTNIEDNAFDIWQDFTTTGHQQVNLSNLGRETTSAPSEPAKEIDSMDLWLTNNDKGSNSTKGVSRIDDSTDAWQGFASFGQSQGKTEVPVEGQFLKDPSGTEPVDLWSSSHTEVFKNHEQINENNEPFDDWQDFKNSHPLETSLQEPPDASLSDNPSASRPDLLGLEFESFAQSALPQSQIDTKDNFSQAYVVPSNEHLERTNGMQQMADVATTSHDNYSIPKSEPVNANVDKLLSQMHDLSFMLKDELSVPDKPVDHSKS